MKISIRRQNGFSGNGSIFFWFTYNGYSDFFLIFPHRGRWLVDPALFYGREFANYREAEQFALTAAVLIAHGRPLPIL